MPLVIRVQATTCQLTIKEASSTVHAAIFSIESLFSITQRRCELLKRCPRLPHVRPDDPKGRAYGPCPTGMSIQEVAY